MIFPRNGSSLSNCLLVTAGVAVGAGATAFFRPSREVMPFSAASAVPAELKAPSARQPALGPRAGGSPSLTEVLSQPPTGQKSLSLHELGQQLAGENPPSAMELAQGIPGDADRLDFLRGAITGWAATNPQAALAYAQAHFPAGQMQSESIRLAIEAWAATDPRAAFVWMEDNLSGPQKEQAMGTFAQSWARTAPEKAAAWFTETGSTSQTLLTGLVTGWAANDPAAAIAWSSQLANPANQTVGLTTAIGELARQDPSKAAAAAAPYLMESPAANPPAGTSPEPTTRAVPDLATVLADIWGANDPAAAAEWVAQLPPGASQIEAATTLATVWAASDIHAAVQWSEGFTDPSLHSAIVEHLATTWGAIEPDKALAWLATQPAGIAANGIQGAYNSWASTDPAGMQDWIAQLPPSLSADQARRSLGDVFSGTDPVVALDLARNMYSPSAQADALNRYYRSWQRKSPADANEWLNSEWASLPVQARQRMKQ